ncbi:MAG: transposase [Alphaproteobacteria bacterium]|nr:transposase [Alphaproteobacteria bacterium]
MICVDGGSGLLASLPTAYPGIAVRRCWAHKIRNVLNKVRKTDHPAVKAGLHAIMNAATRRKAQVAARRFAGRVVYSGLALHDGVSSGVTEQAACGGGGSATFEVKSR